MYVRKLWVALALLAVAVVCRVGEANAQEQLKSRYCYQGTCFDALHKAEALMRGTSVYGTLLRRQKTYQAGTIAGSGVYLQIMYQADDQLPTRIYPSGYSVGQDGPSLGYCVASNIPYNGMLCRSEEEAVQGYIRHMNQEFPSCQHNFSSYKGAQAEPYASISAPYGYGIISYRGKEGARFFNYTAKCPAWEKEFCTKAG